jgi:hypothetical protein
MDRDSPLTGSSSKDPWVGWNAVAHPKANAGGGGPGGFRDSDPLGLNLDLAPPLPHPQSPEARYLALNDDKKKTILRVAKANASSATGQKAKTSAVAQNAPPATVPQTISVRQEQSAEVDIDVSVQVFADGNSNDPSITGARTDFDSTGVTGATPSYQTEFHGKNEIVSALTSKFTLKGTITIQTLYGPTGSPTQTSAYGRGTTPQDEQNGDTSLGFHESCHRQDFLNFLKNNSLPAFTGKDGMKKQDFEAAVRKFRQEFLDYFKRMKADSLNNTDEVGYKLSEYKKKGPRP